MIEQIVRKTEHEELVDWNLLTPDKAELLCSDLVDPLYDPLEEANVALYKSAEPAINKMADVCLEIQNKTWPLIVNTQTVTHVKDTKKLDTIKITLSDGTVANVAMPETTYNHLDMQEEE